MVYVSPDLERYARVISKGMFPVSIRVNAGWVIFHLFSLILFLFTAVSSSISVSGMVNDVTPSIVPYG